MLEDRVKLPLATLRYGVALVMWIWVIDKFYDPAHTARVYKAFYLIPGLELNVSYVIGAVQALIMLAFTFGIKKRISYGLVLAMHTISTVSPYYVYLDPYGRLGGAIPNILFFAAWPMLAAIFTLWWLRDYDTIGVLGGAKTDDGETQMAAV